MSDDKTLALVATKDYSSTEVPAICIDLRQNKIVGKISVKNQRMSLAPNSIFLSPDGKFLILLLVGSH